MSEVNGAHRDEVVSGEAAAGWTRRALRTTDHSPLTRRRERIIADSVVIAKAARSISRASPETFFPRKDWIQTWLFWVSHIGAGIIVFVLMGAFLGVALGTLGEPLP